MKKVVALCFLMMASGLSLACEVCSKQQPKVLRGIAHGAGPDSRWDYLIVILTSLVVLVSLYYSVRWLWKPGETNKDHIKHSIFNYEE